MGRELLESQLQTKVLRDLRAMPFVWVEKISQIATRGTPDILGCVRGVFMAIELKRDSGNVTELQKAKLAAVFKAGGVSVVATPTSWPQLRRAIAEFAAGSIPEETFRAETQEAALLRWRT